MRVTLVAFPGGTCQPGRCTAPGTAHNNIALSLGTVRTRRTSAVPEQVPTDVFLALSWSSSAHVSCAFSVLLLWSPNSLISDLNCRH